MRRNWYDGRSFAPVGSMLNNAFVPQDGAGLKIDLSEYTGKIVDVIVAAKPVQGGAYVPLGRVDNVAVYGEYGTFYTKLNGFYSKTAHNGGSHVVSGVTDFINHTGDLSYSNNVALNNSSYWSNTNTNSTTGVNKTYNLYEPYNVQYNQARLFFEDPIPVKKGGEVILRGYIAVELDPKYTADQYKFYYVLNHGDPVSLGTRSTIAAPNDAITYSQYADYECTTVFDFTGSNYDQSSSQIYFKIPSNATSGEVWNYFVYLEAPNGVRYPVFHTNLKVQ